jgi:hypothetical protein
MVPSSPTPLVFFDVVAHVLDSPAFQLIHTVPGIAMDFPVGRYELQMLVSADGVKPRRRIFELNLSDRELELSRLR